jgi:hypothetical protein
MGQFDLEINNRHAARGQGAHQYVPLPSQYGESKMTIEQIRAVLADQNLVTATKATG